MKNSRCYSQPESTPHYVGRFGSWQVCVGCTMSLILFVLEVTTHTAERSGPGIPFNEGEELAPSWMTGHIFPSAEAVMKILTKL